jgi:suppressor for copper-sensitivity B
MRYIAYLWLVLCVVGLGTAHAATSDWTKEEEIKARLISGNYVESSDKLLLGMHFKLKDNWKTYWRSGGDGGLPLSIDWEGSENIASADIIWPAPERFVAYGAVETFAYKHEVVLPIIVEVNDPTKPLKLKAKTNYASCDELCIFLDKTFELTLEPNTTDAPSEALIDRFIAQVPQANGEQGFTIESVAISTIEDDHQSGDLEVIASNTHGFKEPDLFIEGAGYLRFPKPSVTLENNAHRAIITVPFEISQNDKSILSQPLLLTLVDDKKAIEKPITLPAEFTAPVGGLDILFILAMAFLGGLILNVMPCVLPVLSIKLLSVMKHGGNHPSKIRASFLVSTLGIIVSFVALAAIVVSIKAAGSSIGWGFHFQEPLFLITLVLILCLFCANLWGLFEIPLPSWLGGTLNKNVSQKQHTLAGDFFTGVFATLMATPCSAPFLGTAIGFAFSQGAFEIFYIFTMMGIGLATPYVLFAAMPHLVTKLPKPGMWMAKVKYVMGALLMGTAIWLIWVLYGQLGFTAAGILSALSLLIFLKFFLAKRVAALQGTKLIAAFLLVIASVAMAIPSISTRTSIPMSEQTFWVPFARDAINTHVMAGKVVFVDVTADWCLTCKANKLLVLSKSSIADKLSDTGVVAMKADWTNPDKAIGNYLESYGRFGIPFNIVYGPNATQGIVLPELLSEDAVLDALKKAQ